MRPIPYVLQVVGYKNAGKTTLVCRLVEELTRRGRVVGTVKHDAHHFEMDHPGKDTWRHREAGARIVAISSEQEGKTVILEQKYVPLEGLLEHMKAMEAVIVEGFKSEGYPKIVIIRKPDDLVLLHKVTGVIGIASWLPQEVIRESEGYRGHPIYSIDDVQGMMALVEGHME